MTWFNPPFSKNVKSNIGKEFLKLLDTAFPPTHPLHTLAQALSRHNSKILNEDIQQPQPTLVEVGKPTAQWVANVELRV